MKLIISKSDFVRSLGVVSHAMSSSGEDLFSHFVFRVQENTPGVFSAEVLTTNGMRLYASCPLFAAVVEEGVAGESFTIDGKRLNMWLRVLPDCKLTFTLDKTSIVAHSPYGKIKWSSLDPKNFPFWDNTLKDAQETGSLEASRLHDALSFSKEFTNDKDATDRKVAVCEMQGGVFYSTNRMAASVVTLEGMGKVGIRVHAKDAAPLLSFLASCDQDKIRILETARQALFVRGDGAMFGMARFEETPKIFKPPGEDDRVWEMPLKTLKDAIPYLRSQADATDTKLLFSRPDPTGPVHVSMACKSDKEAPVFEVPCKEVSASPTASPVPVFGVGYPHLQSALDMLTGETVQLGINPKGKSGYLHHHEKRGADSYTMVIIWLKSL